VQEGFYWEANILEIALSVISTFIESAQRLADFIVGLAVMAVGGRIPLEVGDRFEVPY
jgi:hypothetical protein